MGIRINNWEKYKFEDLVENIREQVMPTPKDSEKYIGLEHLDSGSVHVKRWGTPIQLKGTKFSMKKGDLLFARRNAYLRRVAIAPHDGLFSAHGMIFRPKEKVILPSFLPFFLSSDMFWDRAIKISVGSLSPTINWGTLRHEEFKLPSLNDQKRIADLLWSVDSVEQNYITLLKKLHVAKNSYFRETHESKRAKPQSISEIAEVNPRLTKDNISVDTAISFIAMADVSEEGYITSKENRSYGEVKNGLTPFEEGDILFAKITPCMENGKGAIAVGLTNGIGFGSTEFHVLRPKNADDRYYLYSLSMMKNLRQKAGQLMTGSAGQKRVPSDFFDFYKVKFPEASERKIIGQRMKTFDKEISVIKNQINVVRAIKKHIINQIFG